jgi:hypothetical protein
MIRIRPMKETQDESEGKQENSNLAKLPKNINQERKKEGWRKYYNMKKKSQILEMLQESKEKVIIERKLQGKCSMKKC